MRSSLIEAIVAASRPTTLPVVERFPLKGSDGKLYCGDMPSGVSYTGERGTPYYVAQASNGSTVGKRFASREECESWQRSCADARAQEMREFLETADEYTLARQAKHWKCLDEAKHLRWVYGVLPEQAERD